jgi:LysM repeat protein
VFRTLIVLAIAVLALAVAVQTQAAIGSDGSAEHSVVVAPGETLWEIAADHAGSDGVNATVRDIIAMNHLDGTSIDTGQRLQLPE